MNSLISHGYQKGLVNVNELSIDISTVSAKKGRGRRLATTVTRRLKEAKYIQCSHISITATSYNRPWTGNDH
jgi:hypothetical protein